MLNHGDIVNSVNHQDNSGESVLYVRVRTDIDDTVGTTPGTVSELISTAGSSLDLDFWPNVNEVCQSSESSNMI